MSTKSLKNYLTNTCLDIIQSRITAKRKDGNDNRISQKVNI